MFTSLKTKFAMCPVYMFFLFQTSSGFPGSPFEGAFWLFTRINVVYTSLELTIRPWPGPTRKRSYSNHPFSGVRLAVSFRVRVHQPQKIWVRLIFFQVGYLSEPCFFLNLGGGFKYFLCSPFFTPIWASFPF